MDTVRSPQKETGRNIAIGAGAVVLASATVLLARLDPASPSVERSTLFIDSVARGDIVRDVRAPGTLVSEQIRYITAQASARVERLASESGRNVAAGDLLLGLSNPDLQIQTMQAAQQVRQAQIDLLNLQTNLRSQILAQEAVLASMRTQLVNATQAARAADTLATRRLVSTFESNSTAAAADEMITRYRIEQERLELMKQAIDAQVSLQSSQVEQLKAIAVNQQDRLSSLQVRAPEAGVVQDLTLQLGQWVPEGTILARVVQPGKLKAVLRVPESQAKDIQIGQRALIDTRNGVVAGHVQRKDPSAQGGTVTIDVTLDGPLPDGAVPDLSVDGTVIIDNMNNVLHTGRPAFGAAGGTVSLFKLVDDGRAAVRVQVDLGRTAVNRVEVIRGLTVGDRVILSDMTSLARVGKVKIR
ncbi:MAG: HlyD family efflux transporter periplasmic adaptor subunit [Gemmatimonadaceae bacterium]|nr:HlyD family efflux transporter periplasmic adaptor subunit [Gemmatimonadaceae bacterium]